ncbi:helix-turn-helix transcriptional regulator [Flavobacterium sp.]|jgi:excisionase family DNA binding protein|uniref:helix-turn-helix transcriptional regulator n=1 Tax=Flavobacterium sp. TaxID=239 RepID=UPI0037BE467A
MSTNKSEVLSFKQVLEILGVSKSFLYKCTSQGKIPCYRPTKGKLFFKRDEVLDWLNNDFK